MRIALHYKNIDYEYRPIHLVKDGGEHRKEDYLSLNPKGEVPYFIDGTLKLSQSMAILSYIDEKWPSKPLFPSDRDLRSKCIQLSEIINSGIQPLQNLRVMQEVVKRFNCSDQEKKDWSSFWIHEGLSALEKELALFKGPFSMGDALTCVDLYLIPQMYNAKRFGVDLKKFPRLNEISEACLKLDPFIKADPKNQPDSPTDL